MTIEANERVSAGVRFCALALCAFFTLPAQSETYQVDAVHSSIVLRVDHLGFSRSVARVTRWDAELMFDESNPAQNRVDVRIDANSLDFGDETWNRTMRGRRWLDTRSFPEIRFRSGPGGWRERPASAEKDPAPFELVGVLTLHGIEREVILAVDQNRIGVHPYTLKDTIGFSARGSLKRSDFGIDASLGEVGDVLEVWIEIEAQKESKRTPGRKR